MIDEEIPFFDDNIEFPFLHSVETTLENRTYNFVPVKKMKFQIIVSFPIADDCRGNPITIVGSKIHPRSLMEAIKFVERNERQFIESFFSSQKRPEFLSFEVNEANFLEL